MIFNLILNVFGLLSSLTIKFFEIYDLNINFGLVGAGVVVVVETNLLFWDASPLRSHRLSCCS